MQPNYFVNQGDAIAWLEKQQPGICDLIITDPAYQSLEKHRKRGTTTRLKNSKGSSNEWFPIFPNERFERFLVAVYRVLKKDTHFYLQCDTETMFVVKEIAESVGFKFWKPVIWDKKRIGTGYHYRSRYECVLFFEKGKRNLNDWGIPDVLAFDRVNNGYPTEKPVDLLEVFVQQSSEPGQLVIDPFMGSGSTGMAALRNGRAFWGNDIQRKAFNLSKRRFDEAGFAAAA